MRTPSSASCYDDCWAAMRDRATRFVCFEDPDGAVLELVEFEGPETR